MKMLDRRIIGLRKKGWTYREIADQLGCSHWEINDALTLAGLAGKQRLASDGDRHEIAELLKDGHKVAEVSEITGWSQSVVRGVIARNGGVMPKSSEYSESWFSPEEREELSRLLPTGISYEEIGVIIGRHRSSVWREVSRNGGRENYRAVRAQLRAKQCAKRRKVAKLVQNRPLRTVIQGKLKERWSPQQISNWLRYEEYPNDSEMQMSHEAIYQSLYIQGRGALRKELAS